MMKRLKVVVPVLRRALLKLVEWAGMLTRLGRVALAHLGRDLHIYAGLLLLGWGLWISPMPWTAGVVCGSALWYMGVFRLSADRRQSDDGPLRHS